MFITITMKIEQNCYDLKIDHRQKPTDIIKALVLAGKIKGCSAHFYKSETSKRMISAHKSFEDQKVYSGESLIAIPLAEDKK